VSRPNVYTESGGEREKSPHGNEWACQNICVNHNQPLIKKRLDLKTLQKKFVETRSK